MKKSVVTIGLTALALLISGCKGNRPTTSSTSSTEQEEPKDKYTIMVYMCGADLESGYDGYSVNPQGAGLASEDIYEMCTVYNKPEDVNIIIETGGSKAWSNAKINEKKIQRWHVENRVLNFDEELPGASMGKASTFQSFLEWGLTNYPAEKTGVVMWNHGGAMQGVCFDERYGGDGLLSSEVIEGLEGAFTSTGRTEKLEWIGYDACLMQVQDIAEANSDYFNYMVGAEESEAGTGWQYYSWLDDVYAHESTETILTAICDSFVDSYKGMNDQTLSYLDLSKMSDYKTAWESLAEDVMTTVSSAESNAFREMMKTVKCYGSSIDQTTHTVDYGYNHFGTFDVIDFLNKLETNYPTLTTKISAVRTEFSKLVKYNRAGDAAGESNGLCLFFSMNKSCYPDDYYNANETRFDCWRSVVSDLGLK